VTLAIDSGTRFGALVVLRTELRSNGKRRNTHAIVRCDCGTEKAVLVGNLKSGSTTSCGCQRGKSLLKHGMTGTPEHRAWCGMMTRCYWAKPGDRNYALYRGSGVTVAECWHEFTNFLADMGAKPSSQHSLDRYPNASGNYEPGNTRWATPTEQANNWASRNTRYSLNGETLTQAQWCRRLGIKAGTLRDRLNNGWSLELALTLPAVRHRNRDDKGRYANA